MPPTSATTRRRRTALRRGTTTGLNDFNYMCRNKPDRIGIVAEGDSWFSYPRKWIAAGADMNILPHIADKIGGTDTANLLRLSANGDEAVDMTSGKQFARLYKIFKKNKSHIQLVLFSGGGNDIVGKRDMLPLLNEYEAGMTYLECINMDRLERRLDSILLAYSRLLDLCEDIIPEAKIITHTYDIAKPWDQGAEFFWGLVKTQPWVYPYLVRRNIPRALHLPTMRYILEAFADRLVALANEPANRERIHVVATQGTLRPGSKIDWENEIHPSDTGFKKITAKIYAQMKALETSLPA
ncbi:MAG: hypothetical protein HOC23_24115 [Halieaceae bacterium]|nr:hypothetical protein [Halieaceae bacterium]